MKKYAIFVISCLLCVVSQVYAIEKTQTGFYWPIGIANFNSGKGWWMSKDPDYFSNYYHIGTDMITRDLNYPVYAISDGKIIYKHCDNNSWGLGNCALLIKHKTSDNNEFVAIYGHIRTSLDQGNTVSAKQILGTTGPWSSGIHLHFGIHPGPEIPYSDSASGIGWGRMTVSHYPNANGFVDPIAFLKNNAPYLDLSDDSEMKEFNVRVVNQYAWYPPNVDCFEAEYWFEILSDRCTLRDVSICHEIQGTCPAIQ